MVNVLKVFSYRLPSGCYPQAKNVLLRILTGKKTRQIRLQGLQNVKT